VLAQAGVECIGLAGVDADVEVIQLAARALREVGLEDFRIELGLTSLVRDALNLVQHAPLAQVQDALAQKDRTTLASLLESEDAGTRRALLGAATLYGSPRRVLEDAKKAFGPDPRLRELSRVVDRLESELPLVVDLGETRGAAYYTGVSFTVLADGPGEAVGGGGRYDGLMARFGAPATAAGFGFDLSNLEWALHAAGKATAPEREPRFVVASGAAAARESVAHRLRAAGYVAAVVPVRGAPSALDYARSWGYDAAVICRGDQAEVVRVCDEARKRLPKSLGRLGAWAARAGRKPEKNEGRKPT